MYDDPLDSVHINGQSLKQKVLGTLTESAIETFAAKDRARFETPGGSRLNIFKARREASSARLEKCSYSDSWVRDIVMQWSKISGIPPMEADFYRDAGFMDAVRNGRDINIRRFLDDDGWGWVVIRDSPNHWLQKRRLPETTRQELASKKRRRDNDRRW